MKALEVNNAVKRFGGKRPVTAVDDVTFEVGEGEVFGLLGMNGAGKSTLIKMCTGLINADGGSIRVFGADINNEREKAKSMVNVSPQETAVAPLLSVRENLQFIARIYGADKREACRRADEMMEKLDITDRAGDRAGKLSGGLMRRLSVGMALITEPKLVFLDEPTLGLDVLARRELWKIIRKNCGCAVVLTTHYLEEAESVCERIAIMAHGKIVDCGSADELIKRSGTDNFSDAFLAISGVDINE